MNRWLICLLLTGCQALAQPPVAAMLAEPSPEVNRLVAELLGVAEVRLANDALVHDSQLLIERSKLQGLSLEKPELFKLKLISKHCWLSRVSTGQTAELQSAKCIAK
ncbi:hypothetical protein [Iodobacter sp.]|uniref:hypothetical protein n=1 Tax=Iodobacter sp. TaxID=1915058 RepID=UPI0025D075D0|nr:hypothetical protein [Iodobacter sp.]